MNNSLFVLLVITIVSNQTEGGKSLDEEVILPVVGCVAFFSLSKHNKLQNTLKQSLSVKHAGKTDSRSIPICY